MALRIRLARGGAKRRPYYRIVIAESGSPRDGRFIERLGYWNPMLAKDDATRVSLNQERIQHWLDHGALPTDRVARFLDAAGLFKRTPSNNPNKGRPGKKRLEREAAAAEKAKEAEAAPAAEEAPAQAPTEPAA